MLRSLIVVTLLTLSSAAWSAIIKIKKDKGPEIDPVTWVVQKGDTLPSTIDGIRIFRPMTTDADGNPIVNGSILLKGIGKEQAFIGAFVKTSADLDREFESIRDVDFNAKSFTVDRQVVTGEGGSQAIYRYQTTYSFKDGAMDFTSSDINIEYKDRGILNRRLPVGKLRPATNERHRQLLEDFSEANSMIAHDMTAYAAQHPGLKVTHWDDIARGVVVKGMNQTEVRMIGGEPRSISGQPSREQWMYNNDFVVIFSDGIVTNVIQ